MAQFGQSVMLLLKLTWRQMPRQLRGRTPISCRFLRTMAEIGAVDLRLAQGDGKPAPHRGERAAMASNLHGVHAPGSERRSSLATRDARERRRFAQPSTRSKNQPDAMGAVRLHCLRLSYAPRGRQEGP